MEVIALAIKLPQETATARKIVDILVDHGWLVRVDGGAIVNGKKRKDVWQIMGRVL